MLAFVEPMSSGCSITLEVEQVIAQRVGPPQDAVVADTVAYGRALFLDGLIQSAAADEALYHEALVHPAAIVAERPQRVLIAGVGEGASLREILRHPGVERVVAVDLDPGVIELSRAHLRQWHQGAWDDPRVELAIEDARATLARIEAGAFDLAIVDVTDPVDDGPSSAIFTVEFFAAVRARLGPRGVMVVQAGELDPSDLAIPRSVLSTVQAAFGSAALAHVFVPSFHCAWGFVIGRAEPFDPLPADLEARIEPLLGAAGDGLRCYDAAWHRALFSLPRSLRAALERPGRVVRAATGAPPLVAYPRR